MKQAEELTVWLLLDNFSAGSHFADLAADLLVRGAALGLLPSGSVPVLRTSFVGSLPRCAHKLVSLAQRVALCGWRTCRARCYCVHAALQSCWPRSPTPHRVASPEDVAGLRRGLMLHRGVVA